MKKIYVVEGIRDEELLKRIDPDIITIKTNGFSIDNELIDKLVELEKEYKIILILDPDYPGEKIRRKLSEKLNSPSHIYIPKEKAISKDKRKVGLEYVDIRQLEEILKHEIHFTNNQIGNLKISDFINLKLTNEVNSQLNRLKITNYFNLPRSNAKRLLKYLNQMGISYKKIEEVLNES